ncbi:MAG: M1 family metallopeptidase [Bacteroidota bacterium]
MNWNFKNDYRKVVVVVLFTLVMGVSASAQTYWQQAVDYTMSIDFDVEKNQFKGEQTLVYTNNSPDTLTKVFYHLYFNAFQPGSMMDVRSRTIEDPDRRVLDRISKLDETEIGFHKIKSLSQDGKKLSYEVEGTVLEVTLNQPILPEASSTFEMDFETQVPLQIRRTGRDNKEGIEYSMSQWYPKMAEYDQRGWHAHPYVAREFYAPYGTFDVSITIDKSYVLAATGTLQNPQTIGFGYEQPGTKVKKSGKKLTWQFTAENVHDFVWAADPDYVHKIAQVENGPELHFFYQPGEKTTAWEQLIKITPKAFKYMEETFGVYPYSHYSIIQGGDGGMEYPMATLINGEQGIGGLLSVTVHEAFHSWYQGVLGFNESYHEWMDEGFTTYAQDKTLAFIRGKGGHGQEGNYAAYQRLTQSGKEEPMSTHADQYETNYAYSRAAYIKGAVAIAQMNYLVGEQVTLEAQKKFYNQWKFKHPTPNDWIRVFEKESGLELDWYLDYWMNSTKTIDYGIKEITALEDGKTSVLLQRVGKMPMPMEIYVTTKDGAQKLFYAPLSIMRGKKVNETDIEREILADWPWTHPEYEFSIDIPLAEISKIQIDTTGYLADISKENNLWENQ